MYEAAQARRKAVNKPFKWILIGSVALHVGAFGAVVYAQSLRPKREVRDAIPVQLVKLGKPRDPELLPRKVKAPPPPPPVDDAINLDTGDDKKKPPPPPPKTKPKKPPPEMSDAAKRLLDDSRRDDAALDDALSKLDDAEGDPDGFAEGTTTDPAQAARGYEATVAASLKRAYQLPTLLESQRQFLVAEVAVFIAANGRISRYEVEKAHPNELFMNSVESMLRSHELPPPPKELARRYATEGLLVRFKP